MFINQRIKEYRKANNISQVELAKAINVSQGNVGDWERGKAKPGADAIISLAKFFGVTTDMLLLGDDVIIKSNSKLELQTIEEVITKASFDYLKLSDEEKEIILRHREGNIIIVDKNLHKLKGEIGTLNEMEIDLILKLRNMDQRIQEDFYDNLCWRYEKENHKKISYESKIG